MPDGIVHDRIVQSIIEREQREKDKMKKVKKKVADKIAAEEIEVKKAVRKAAKTAKTIPIIRKTVFMVVTISKTNPIFLSVPLVILKRNEP